MNIFIDESGSFVFHPKRDSWSVVVAVCSPESSRRALSKIVEDVRRAQGLLRGEVKLPMLGEKRFLSLLSRLAETEMTVFATATDSGLNEPALVQSHKAAQVAGIRSNIPKMRFEGGRQALTLLANQLESLPNQLYVQLLCQVNLIHDVIDRAINYYVQRKPATLREFRWRIDQKNTSKTVFEETFEKIAPPLLQAHSIREPTIRIREFDYRHLSTYEFADGEWPTYLQEEYGLPPMDGINVQKLLRGNLAFVDSNTSDGVQVADLLASGLRRVLKNSFDDPAAIASAMGRLTVQNRRGKQSINLISLGPEETLPARTASVVRHLDSASKLYIRKRV